MKAEKNIKCNQIYPYIASEVSYASVEKHLSECKICSERLENIERVISILDESVEVPANLVDKTMQKRTTVSFPEKQSIDFSKYLQIAAVLAAAIFLGAILGRNANSELLSSKKHKKDKALIEYKESHLLDERNSFYKL